MLRVGQSLDVLDREKMDIGRPSGVRGPLIAAIGRSGRPIDGNAPFGQPRELFVEKVPAARTGPIGMDELPGEQDEVDLFGQGQIEDACRRVIGGLGQHLEEVIGNLGQAMQRLLQVKVGCLQESKWPALHRRLQTLGTIGVV